MLSVFHGAASVAGQGKIEHGSLALFPFCPDPAAVTGDDPLYCCKADARTLEFFVSMETMEGLEHRACAPDCCSCLAWMVRSFVFGSTRISATSFTTADNVVAEGDNLTVRPLLDSIPQTPAEMESFKKSVLENPIWIDRLASRQGCGVTNVCVEAGWRNRRNGVDHRERARDGKKERDAE